MKRYMDSALLYAVLALAGGVFYREFTKFHGFFLTAASSGKEFLFHQCQGRPYSGGLSCGSESDCCDAGGAWSDSGAGNCTLLRRECCHFRYGWGWTYPAGSKLGDPIG